MFYCESAPGTQLSTGPSDGRTHRTKIRTAAGGVGRNLAEALSKLEHNPVLISCIGDDLFGRELWRHFHTLKMDTSKIFTLSDTSTAIYSALLNANGECVFGLGDMEIYDLISAKVITEQCGQVIRDAGIVIIDGNLSVDVMTHVMTLCVENRVPLWFEPTEVRKAKKILQVPRELWKCVRFLSPNLRELASIVEMDLDDDDLSATHSGGTNNNFTFDLSKMQSLYEQCFSLFVGLEIILLTNGKYGIQIISRQGHGEIGGTRGLSIASYPPPDIGEGGIKSVSGAGDCLNAGFISGILQGMSWPDCAILGTMCAKKSLESMNNVPEQF